MTQVILLGSAILLLIPIIMILLSLVLKANSNRIVNIIDGIANLAVLVSTFFTGRNPDYYILLAAIKAVLMVLIVWFGWRWPRQGLAVDALKS